MLISHEEYQTSINEKGKYEKMKETIRIFKSDDNGLNKTETKIDKKIRENHEYI